MLSNFFKNEKYCKISQGNKHKNVNIKCEKSNKRISRVKKLQEYNFQEKMIKMSG